ncbi:hypothetical protein [uncultured Tenacibaculum sp.]|uniref:ATP-grasp domain-containing protein n=1 Tax=uncultured Tenacibaculum sp. TaxID=174713 RepID=UPI002626022E|nr:hypothetical protein [uncultured Tenacibaculum sp.]
MNAFDVIILTDNKHLKSTENNLIIQNVLDEDNYVKLALERLGLKTLRLSWDDTSFDWSKTKFILFRSTWDYQNCYSEFSNWLNKVSKQTTMLNSENIIRWNVDKHYLLDLQNKGVNICESYFLETSESRNLQELATEFKLSEFILKPCVSGGGRHTYKINKNNIAQHEEIFSELISNEAMIIQPFQYNITEKGEISLVLINGKFTHAVLKKAKRGDFRVQDDFGGSVYNYTPTQAEIEFAKKAIKACSETPIYARVDIFTDNNGNLAIAELELIEPELWFRNNPQAADKLAVEIQQLLQ